jgi:hypothetical protein
VTARFLAVKGFRRFQHYRDRNPVWIKLYTDVLVDPGFDGLPEAAQAQLIKIWIFRAQYGPMKNDRKFLAGKIGVRGKFHVDALIAAGFLVETDDPDPIEAAEDSASKVASKTDSNALAERLANPEQNAIGSVRADARSRESESGEGESTHSLPSDAVRLCTAANRGLAEHPKRPQAIPKIYVGQGSTVEAMEILRAAGVPIEFAEEAVFEAARSHTSNKGVSGLKYFASRVVEQWQIKQSNGASTPRRVAANGVTDRARLILAIANTHGLTSYIGNPDDYRRRQAEAADDPRAFPDFLETIKPLDLAHGIGNQPEPFALKELVRRIESAPTNGVHA